MPAIIFPFLLFAAFYIGAMPTFDIVSQIDRQEVDNALNQARKEVVTRFDLKGSNATIEQPAKDKIALLPRTARGSRRCTDRRRQAGRNATWTCAFVITEAATFDIVDDPRSTGRKSINALNQARKELVTRFDDFKRQRSAREGLSSRTSD